MPKWMSTCFSIETRGGNAKNSCPSAIDAAGYISREELYCEYDGHTYKLDLKKEFSSQRDKSTRECTRRIQR
ncbi:hypothetical protein [Pseudobutyrivibrio sp. JW11]|uniref:hypothetical protein n=1 Tax=Pseudobutyrivibrio sp. JW11 TaxID=1855302 RepID=UPI000B87D041|nr:hypothetical protein [Pseudobutyrivibrio sp. JW11]